MKFKSLFLALSLIATAAIANQDAVSFERKYAVGEKDTFNFKSQMSMSVGSVDISMTMVQAVKKVYENGDADIETEVKDLKVNAMGNEMSPPSPPATSQRVTKFGQPVGKAAEAGSGGGMRMDFGFMRYASFTGDKPMKVGDEIKIDQTDKENPKNKVTGTVKLESVTDGVALISSKLEVTVPEIDKPIKLNSKAWIASGTGKLNKMEGKVDGFEAGGMQMDSMTFSMERAK